MHKTSEHWEATDRYQALGMACPDPASMCHGQCEGTGWVPIHDSERAEPWRSLWVAAEDAAPADDGWHFVVCPDCHGTGKAQQKGASDA